MIKDILKDIVEHTYSLGLDLVKVTGDQKETTIEALAENKEVIVQAQAHNPILDLVGTFGMRNLNKLDHHLKNPEYKENAEIKVVWEMRNGENQPAAVHFENESGDYKNEYKLLGTALINEKLKSVKFKGATWQVEVEPSITSINRFKLQAAANSDESVFLVKTEKDILKFYFGDASTHEGSFIFQTGIEGKLKQNWTYPIQKFLSILSLDGDKAIKFSDDGVALITVNSGLINYDYFIPAQTK